MAGKSARVRIIVNNIVLDAAKGAASAPNNQALTIIWRAS
jgi:hypothetical protein